MPKTSTGRSSHSTNIPDILDFFPAINNDISKIVWGHAINDQKLLAESLSKDSTIMMLEADVSKGHLEGELIDSKAVPIMSHPPNVVSDTTLEMWIGDVIKANQNGLKKGAKLDFKSPDIVLKSLEILRKHNNEINFPLWLNADILKGPGGDNSKPVDADIFLSQCSEFFPHATLSIGWTTGYEEGETQKYTQEMIREMNETIRRNNIQQPVTFPIRAAFVSNSLDNLEALIKSFPEETLTIWTSASDSVDLGGLASLQDVLGEDSVYFDISEQDKIRVSELRKEKQSPETKSSGGGIPLSSASVSLIPLIYPLLL